MKEKLAHSQPTAQIKITFMDNGNVTVNGFPNSFELALSYMNAGTHAVMKYFIELGKAGQLDGENNKIENKIIVPKSKFVGPDGKLLQ